MADLAPEAIVFSPGPCAPQQAGESLDLGGETFSGELGLEDDATLVVVRRLP